MIPFKEKEMKQSKDIKLNKSIFDDSYQKAPQNETKTQQRFYNNYIKGQMKSNILFDDNYVRLY
jgi:hypothetical protein